MPMIVYPNPRPLDYRIMPTGECWCGCGAATTRGAFFRAGHDRKAETKVIKEIFGGVPEFLMAYGREPGHQPRRGGRQ